MGWYLTGTVSSKNLIRHWLTITGADEGYWVTLRRLLSVWFNAAKVRLGTATQQ